MGGWTAPCSRSCRQATLRRRRRRAYLQPGAGSRLARQGLREGDIITGSNRVRIRDLAEFQEVVRSVSGTLYLQVRRNGNDYVARID